VVVYHDTKGFCRTDWDEHLQIELIPSIRVSSYRYSVSDSSISDVCRLAAHVVVGGCEEEVDMSRLKVGCVQDRKGLLTSEHDVVMENEMML
jgi:hypothetical protein